MMYPTMITTPRRTFRRNMTTVKGQWNNNRGLRLWQQSRKDILSAVKDVQVSCMNKIYKGIGFRNDNGGLEFYSDDCKKRLASKIEEDVEIFRERLELAENELESVICEIDIIHEHIDEWTADLQHKEEECQQARDQLECLILQAKLGEIPEVEREKLRNRLKFELRQAESRRDDAKSKVERYREVINRKWYLEMYIQELTSKIEEKEKDAVASNTFTVHQPGILTFPFVNGLKSKSCCLFADILDYLAYVYQVNENKKEGFPRICDSIVLNDPRNFLKLFILCDTYDSIYCFFPNTISGKTMEETIISRHGSRVVSMSHLYDGSVSLFEHSDTLDDFSPLSMIL